ncbi:hypothetical protein DV736_g947, partial [Chaetothyriales sp. CBS 134916]
MEDDDPFEKAETVDVEVRAYVYSLVNALGGSSADEDGRYILGDDALACLRDLKRWLKLYDEKLNRLDVARCLAEAKLVTGDLLPILTSWKEDGRNDRLKARVALACLELLVPLTWPMEPSAEMTMNHHRHMPYIQQSQVLYKAAILSWNSCRILRQATRIALPSIALPRDQRTARDEGIIKLLLYFLRNVLSIRQVPNLPSQGLEMELSRSATIDAFRDQDVFALLLTVCSNMGDDFNSQDIILLDILFNLVKGVDVKKLWMTKSQREGHEFSDLKARLSAEQYTVREAKTNAPSRHSRFGAMIWVKGADGKMSSVSGQDSIKDNRAFFNIDKSKKWTKPQTKQKDIQHTMYDFNRFENLTDSAAEKLRNFVEEFLDSGFNPLFTHLRKAIESEAERVLDINYRQFFYCVAWFLDAERCRREMNKNEKKPANVMHDFSEAESYSLVAAVLNQETFITLNRYMQASIDNKEYQDLNASMRCFTQILLTVQEMAQSSLEEDQEIANNIQNRIFYEEATHDRIVGILKGYKDQGFGYLDACTELAHVFLRMLERYSKENIDLQVRSRRKARHKRKKEAAQQMTSDGQEQDVDNDTDSENEDLIDTVQVSKERKFDFNRFAAKFTSQSSVNTFTHLLAYFKDLNTEQLKHCHRFFYRVAFKQDQAVLLYRVDIISLFYKLIKGPDGMDPKSDMYLDFSEFSRQLFKKMLKKLQERPELMTELLFSKINSTLYYLEYGREKQTSTTTRPPAELEVKPAPGRGFKEQIGIVVTALVKDEKRKLVGWVKSVLARAVSERTEWEAEAVSGQVKATAELESDGGILKTVDVGEPSNITARPTDEETRLAMFKNARLRLLMRLCTFTPLGDEDAVGTPWIIPGRVKAEQLKEAREAIEQYELRPWQSEDDEDGPEDMLRRVRKQVMDADGGEGGLHGAGFIDDDSEGDDGIEFEFPDNVRSKSKPDKRRSILEELKKRRKRKRDEPDSGGDDGLDDAVAAERRRKRKDANDERRRKIKSELYVIDSDDDGDPDFFKREEELRKRQEEVIQRQIALGIQDQQAQAKKKKQQKRRDIADIVSDVSEDEDDMTNVRRKAEQEGDNNKLEETYSSQTANEGVLDSDEDADEEEQTPISSQSQTHSESNISTLPLKELPQPRAVVAAALSKLSETVDVDVQDDELDGDMPLPTASRRSRVRGGFIVDSDDEE